MSDEITKQNIVLVNKKMVSVDFQGKEILVRPYISLNDKIQLTKTYLDSFFHFQGEDFYAAYLGAEYSIILATVDLCTNIEVSGLRVDDIINSGLFDIIVPHINNYYETIDNIQNVVRIMREDIALEKSIGNTIGNLSAKISVFVDKIAELDFSPEGVNKLIEKLNEQKLPKEFIIPIEPVVETKVELPAKKTRKKKVE